jgi:trehalose/maltose hydrolase-like predicted phosphorylase
MGWVVEETGWDRSKIAFWGSKFLTGNGYMGLRGTVEECTAAEMASCTLAGLYDRNGDSWREPVNLAFPFHLIPQWNGAPLSLLETAPSDVPDKSVSHWQGLDVLRGVFSRQTVFAIPEGTLALVSRRFVSMDDKHLMALRYTITASAAGTLSLSALPFGAIWDINGPHLKDRVVVRDGKALVYTARTIELNRQVAAAVSLCINGAAAVPAGDGWRITLNPAAGETVELCLYVSVYKEGDGDVPAAEAACSALDRAQRAGFETLEAENAAAWQSLWNRADVIIEGDDEAQLALRYSIYLLLISTPFHSGEIAIPARGLSGQVYKGAFFWDTEIYMMPFFACCLPEVCRNLAMYRVHTLDGARRKAAEYRYSGAFYPWESQETGEDACTDFNLTDVHTGRPMRTYFRSGQIHISADVAWGIWSYFTASGDEEFLLEGGAEVLFECARFFYSRCLYRPSMDRYEFLDVTGADEYHERVNNNAYTNAMIRLTLRAALEVYDLIKQKYPENYEALMNKLSFYEEPPRLRDLLDKLYVPAPDPETGLIEQFDGYFDREDVTPEALQTRELKANEYWGSPSGLAVETQVIKQADVVLLLALLGGDYTPEQKAANWRYYEQRTEHGSSLSACGYALLAAQCGMRERACALFRKTAELDLKGDYKLFLGTLYIGGTHPAANGGAWMAAIHGFAGLSLRPDGVVLSPALPVHWKSLAFFVSWHGQALRVTIRSGAAEVRAQPDNGKAVPVTVFGQRKVVPIGGIIRFTNMVT